MSRILDYKQKGGKLGEDWVYWDKVTLTKFLTSTGDSCLELCSMRLGMCIWHAEIEMEIWYEWDWQEGIVRDWAETWGTPMFKDCKKKRKFWKNLEGSQHGNRKQLIEKPKNEFWKLFGKMKDSKERKGWSYHLLLGSQSSVFLKLRIMCKFVLSFDSIITIDHCYNTALKSQ